MTYFKIIILNVLFIHNAISQEIEYYPSQASIFQRKLVREMKPEFYLYKHVVYKREAKLRIFNEDNKFDATKNNTQKRAVDPVFHGHPKTREELWNEKFINETLAFDQTPSLISLIHNITLTYLNDCIPIILYDSQVKSKESYLFQKLLKDFPIGYTHGYINDNDELAEPKLLRTNKECINFIVFLADVTRSAKVLGKQAESKVVIVARSSQWAVQEFLAGPESRMFVNLIVIGQSFKDGDDDTLEAPYILYTHKLYTDGLGASQPVVLNSWSHGKFSRPINLFPHKMTEGYAGHRFVVAAANQPPFIFRTIKTDLDGGNPRVVWEGIEMRLLALLAERNNFSIEVKEPLEPDLGPGDAVLKEVTGGRADVGVAGLYITSDRTRDTDMSFSHSSDCAVFVTRMSTALPRYRAILGPFHWTVWLALTLTYLFGIFPLAFSDKHTLRHLLHNSGEIENMFWYVFGTFTNCFTFVGKNSWSKTTKITTRLLIGWYWLFTIIITSCYTGSIIAFVTLPVFPETIDSIQQLLDGFYRIGTLDRGGWEKWFLNSSDPKTKKLLKNLQLVQDVPSGIRNTTKAFFLLPFAFLGSKAELEYIIQSNFTQTRKNRKAQLHISNECFVPFGVSLTFPNNSIYTAKLSGDIARMLQSGLIYKIEDEVRWEMQRSATGKRLSVAGSGSLKLGAVAEKGLTLADTQGMFLLLAAGFILAATALVSEWMGGCSRKCRRPKKEDAPISANSREHLIPSPKSDIDSEIKIISDSAESRFFLDPRPSSEESRDSLEGTIINVTKENIIIHDNFSVDGWDSRRSSSVDIDKEVQEIFKKDENRRRTLSGVNQLTESQRQATASKGAFGDHLSDH
uniref:Putative ionotropic receptor IR21a n=1 Tax=Hedya nubiferana TaxID=572853 RepID=A0A223HCX2_9NEOP|nr:putative ionotropic receptor IR21a [Hedya nubiferana]